MKRGTSGLLFLFVSLTSASALAQVRDRAITDRGYIVTPGQVQLTGATLYQTATYRNESTAGTKTTNQMLSLTTQAQVEVGVLPGLALAVNGGYKISERVTDDDDSDYERNSNGMTDPSAQLRYRLFEQTDSLPFDVVLGLSHRPGTGVKKSPSATRDGDGRSGSASTTFDISLFRRTQDAEFGLIVSRQQDGEAQEKTSDTGTLSVADELNTTRIQALVQVAYNERTSIMAGGGFSRTEAQTLKTDGYTLETDAFGRLYLDGGLRILVVPDVAFVDIGLAIQMASEVETKISNGYSSKMDTTQGSYTLGFHYFF